MTPDKRNKHRNLYLRHYSKKKAAPRRLQDLETQHPSTKDDLGEQSRKWKNADDFWLESNTPCMYTYTTDSCEPVLVVVRGQLNPSERALLLPRIWSHWRTHDQVFALFLLGVREWPSPGEWIDDWKTSEPSTLKPATAHCNKHDRTTTSDKRRYVWMLADWARWVSSSVPWFPMQCFRCMYSGVDAVTLLSHSSRSLSISVVYPTYIHTRILVFVCRMYTLFILYAPDGSQLGKDRCANVRIYPRFIRERRSTLCTKSVASLSQAPLALSTLNPWLSTAPYSWCMSWRFVMMASVAGAFTLCASASELFCQE